VYSNQWLTYRDDQDAMAQALDVLTLS
jgi:hypothetical protein